MFDIYYRNLAAEYRSGRVIDVAVRESRRLDSEFASIATVGLYRDVGFPFHGVCHTLEMDLKHQKRNRRTIIEYVRSKKYGIIRRSGLTLLSDSSLDLPSPTLRIRKEISTSMFYLRKNPKEIHRNKIDQFYAENVPLEILRVYLFPTAVPITDDLLLLLGNNPERQKMMNEHLVQCLYSEEDEIEVPMYKEGVYDVV